MHYDLFPLHMGGAVPLVQDRRGHCLMAADERPLRHPPPRLLGVADPSSVLIHSSFINRSGTRAEREPHADTRSRRASIPPSTVRSRVGVAARPVSSIGSLSEIRTNESGQERRERDYAVAPVRHDARPHRSGRTSVRAAAPVGPAPPPTTCGRPEARRASASPTTPARHTAP